MGENIMVYTFIFWVSVSFITVHKSTLISKFQISKHLSWSDSQIKATEKKHGREHKSTRKNGIREKVKSEQ